MSRATLRARLDVATPGPWTDEGGAVGHPSGDDIAECWDAIGRDGGNSQTNAALIAHARQDLPALLALADAVADAIDGCDLCGETYVCSAHKDMNAALAAVEALP